MELGPDGSPEIKVRDVASGMLVAYSSMSADYGASLEEFIMDYMVD